MAKEEAIEELQLRLQAVPGVKYVKRNSTEEPNERDLPAISFFEMGDRVVKADTRGASYMPVYRRELVVIVEVLIKGTNAKTGSKELDQFERLLKKSVYNGGITLGGTCAALTEVDCSQTLRPPMGGNVFGKGIAFKITYNEDVSTY
jgi:hypothetical protein